MTNRTKIVATIGPASSAPHVLRQLIEAGVDVFRLNFSHGTHDTHSAVLADIRAISREIDCHVAVLQDLCGPKMRLEPFPGDVVDCGLGDEFTLVTEPTSEPRALMCSYRELPNDLKPGESVLFADGTVAMTVTEAFAGGVRLRVTLPGRLRSRQGLNLPGTDLAVSSLTDKDLRDLDWTARHAADVDFVGLSFVRRPEDIAGLRQALEARGCGARIVVKIEKPQAVRNLEATVAAADAVMVARGDLGVEMPLQQVPAIQKRIIALCNQTHRPVIVATQMLNSMEQSSRPTRAEASDVFNAVVDGADAVMLSGESAVGQYPVEAVRVMRDICAEAEAFLKSRRADAQAAESSSLAFTDSVTGAAVDGACLMARRLGAALIIVSADSGRTALALSNRRPDAAILALCRNERVARKLSLCWGVAPMVIDDTSGPEQLLALGIARAKSQGLVNSGQHAVLLRGGISGRSDIRAVLAGVVR